MLHDINICKQGLSSCLIVISLVKFAINCDVCMYIYILRQTVVDNKNSVHPGSIFKTYQTSTFLTHLGPPVRLLPQGSLSLSLSQGFLSFLLLVTCNAHPVFASDANKCWPISRLRSWLTCIVSFLIGGFNLCKTARHRDSHPSWLNWYSLPTWNRVNWGWFQPY